MAAVTKAGFKSSLRSQDVVDVVEVSGGSIETLTVLAPKGMKEEDVESKIDSLRGIFSIER